jgi:hypothetical protein
MFYLPLGHWPDGEESITLDNVKWMGVTVAARAEKRRSKAPTGAARRTRDGTS